MTAQSAPQREIGYAAEAGPNSYNWWMYDGETTPELRWPQSVQVYDQMRTQDAQIKSVLAAVTFPVRRTQWRIDPNGARDEVVRLVADDLGLPVVGESKPNLPLRTKDRFSWAEHVRLALLMLPFGHMFFEQVYRVTEDGSRAHLRKLGERLPQTIFDIKVARDGGLVSITQTGSSLEGDYGQQRPIPVNRLVAYVLDKEGGNWLGRSILRPAYKNWLLKDRLLRVQAQTVERNGMGVPTYTAAETETDLSKGKALATSLRAGETAGAAIPNGATLQLLGVTGTLPDADTPIRYHDEQIARAVLAHFLNLGTQTGSWALGTTFADFFTLSLQTLADQIADTATQHVVEDLVDINWGPEEPAPRIVHDEIGSRQQATAQAIKSLVDAGILEPDEVLEESTRQQYGLPPKDPETTRGQDQQGGFGQPFYAPEEGAATGGGSEVYASADIDDYDDGEPGQFDELTAALAAALSEFIGEVRAAGLVDWDPSKHPRDKAGRFRTVFARVMHALELWSRGEGGDHPLKGQGFTTANLRTVATRHFGLKVRRSTQKNPVTAEEIEGLLLDHVRTHVRGRREAVPPRTPVRFTLQGPAHHDVDVQVHRGPGDKPVLFRLTPSGRQGRKLAEFDSLDDMAAWADDNGEPHVAEWARAEGGRGKLEAPSTPGPDLTGANGLSTDPAVRAVQVENRIRAAYARLAKPGRDYPNYVSMTDVRVGLGDVPRAEQDAALFRLSRESGVHLAPENKQSLLTTDDREAGLVLPGDRAAHLLAIADPSPRPLPGRAPAKATPGGAPGGKKASPRRATSKLPSGADIEVVQSTRNLSNTQIVQGHTLTAAGQRALDALGPAGHPRIAAIPDTEEKIREAYRMLAVPGGGNDSYVALIDVRKLIGEQVPRSEVDDVLRRLQRARGDVRLEGQAYGRHNVAERVPASIRMGGTELNLLHIDDPTLSRPSRFPAVDMAQELVNRRDGGPRHPMMVNLSDADLRAEVDRRMANDPIAARDVASYVPTYTAPGRAAPSRTAIPGDVKAPGGAPAPRGRRMSPDDVFHDSVLGDPGTPVALARRDGIDFRLVISERGGYELEELGPSGWRSTGERFTKPERLPDLDWRRPPAPGRAAAKVGGAKATRDLGAITTALESAATREEGERHLDGLTVAELKQLRSDIGLSGIATTKAGIREEILRQTVLRRLEHEAYLRKAAPVTGVPTPRPSSRAVAKTTGAPRARKAAPPAGRPPAKPVPIRNLFDADDATIETALKDVFEGKFGPYTTKATVSIRRAGTRIDKKGREHEVAPSIGIGGEIYDADGNKIGYFGRNIGPVEMHYNDGTVRREMWADHKIVQLGEGDYDDNPTKYHGKGFGGEFNRRAIEWYRASGLHGISQHDHNGYVWASQGFNFGRGGRVPDYLQEDMRELIADLRAGKRTSNATKDVYRTIPKRFRDAPDLDAQIVAAEALLARLARTKPGDPDYPTAYEISQLGRRKGQRGKTALWLGKLLWVSADEMILNPDEGEVLSQ